jgi:hypothetical protein
LLGRRGFGQVRQALPLAGRRPAIPQQVASPLASPVRDLLHTEVMWPAKTMAWMGNQ